MTSNTAKKGLHLVQPSPANPTSPYFRASEPVLQSGLYRVFHAGHRLSHEVILLAGELFPRCAECKHDVHFELIKSVPTIANDPAFIRIYEIPHPRKKEAEADEEVVA